MRRVPTLVMSFIFALASSGGGNAQVFYVSPTGDDAASGALGAPWRTLAGAKDNLRSGGHLDGSGDITVNFRGGTYVFDQTVVFGSDDGGTPSQRITYAAQSGETPVFSSLVQVTGWSAFNGNIMEADLPAGIEHVRYLQDASENWLPRSASATFESNEPGTCLECTYDDPVFQANKSNVQYPVGFSAPDWSFADEYDLRVTTAAWELGILPIASVDVGDRRISTTVPGLYELRKDNVEPDIQNINWILNTIEGITGPGQWAVVDGTVYLWPPSGTDDIFVPRLTELIRVDEGTVDGNAAITAPLENIHFQGLTFTGGDFYALQTGDSTVQHDWSVVDRGTALLRFRNVTNCSVTQSTFTKSGSTGVRFDRYAQGNSVENNTFSYLGREAIVLSGRAPDRGDVMKNNTIRSNHITATGREKWAAPAILIDQGSNNTVSWNYITDTDATAIVLTAPRQLVLLSHGESGGPSDPAVREFHYQEIPASVTQFVQGFADLGDGSREAMQFTYNHDNRVSDNALVDVTQARGFFVNGYVYVSGAQRHGTNYLERNYIYDSGDNLQNNMAFYSDSDQDNCEYIGNMVHNLDIGDSPAPFPLYNTFAQWADSTPDTASGRILLQGNMTQASTFATHVNGQSIVEDGNVIDGVGASASQAATYEQMYTTLCPNSGAPGAPWPGSAAMQTALEDVIEGVGGAVPSCSVSSPTADFTQSPAAPVVGESIQFTDTSTGNPTSWDWSFADGSSSTVQNPQHSFATAGDYQVTLEVANAGGNDSITKTVTVTAATGCAPGSTTMCLNQGRFRVEVDFKDFQGNTGQAQVVTGTPADDSGLLWFFSEDNWEMLVKVLDACSFNNHFWVFSAATTNVEYTLRVTDTQTSGTMSYFNPLGAPAAALTDTMAFATCPSSSTTSPAPRARVVRLDQNLPPAGVQVRSLEQAGTGTGACTDEPDQLCLTGNRFLVEVEFTDFQGNEGGGQVVQFRSSDSGLFWFFQDDNWEMLVKVLDACGLNDHFWVFSAATTNVEYTLQVTDTQSNQVKEYFNPLGNSAAAITDTMAFMTCP